MRIRKPSCTSQLSLFPECETVVEHDELPPYIDHPTSDNDRLLNMQHDYYGGDDGALARMYLEMLRIAASMIRREREKKNFFLTTDDVHEKACGAAERVIEQYVKNKLVVKKSVTAYLFLQVRAELYQQKPSERFESYCVKHNKNLFALTEAEKKSLRNDFETEENERKRSRKK